MKRLRFLPIALAVMLASCVKNPMTEFTEGSDGEGLLKIDLSVDESLQIVQTRSELDASLVPHVDSLYVDLYRYAEKILRDKEGNVILDENGKPKTAKDKTWNRMYFGKYEDAKDTVLRVNTGDWKMLAFHGDSTACGFDKPYFLAEKTFTVDGGLLESGDPNVTKVSAEAKVSNVRITVNFDASVPGSFYDYFVRLTNLDRIDENGNPDKYRQILRYKSGETRDAYMMPAEHLQIEFMAQYEYGGEDSWRFVNLGAVAVAPNDHLTINLSVNPRNGGLDVNISTETDIMKEETEIEILEAWAPQDAPQVVAAGFVDGDHAVVEGDRTGNGATISVVARAGLKNFFFKVESEYLTTATHESFDIPLGEEIDLADPSLQSDERLARLKAAGFSWDDDMRGSRKLTYLTMTDLFTTINDLNPSLTTERNLAKFTIRVVDDVNKETELELRATAYPIVQTLSIPEGRVWANKIVSPELTVSRGVSKLFMLQVSSDGQTWTDLKTFESADNSVIDFGELAVQPNTTYHYRTIYNNNPNLMSEVVTVMTEEELQVGNSGFEDYQTRIMHVTPMGSIGGLGALDYSYDREWYLPYAENDSDPWWAVNSKKTMPDGHTAWTSSFCKNFPCTAYSTDRYEGEKSAMVYTVNVGNGNSDGTAVGTSVPGEIWIGTADDNGNHTRDGHAFASRPASVKFMYRYAPINNENFVVYVSLKDKDGNEIARSEKLDGAASAEWTECEIPVVYSDLETKAASIYICFKSSAAPGVRTAVTMEIAGKQQTAHLGSALRIDNVELVY